MMQPVSSSNRRGFLKRFFQAGLWTGVVGSGGSYAYARLIERKHPVIERVKIPLRALGSGFEGFRIVQISDLHVEPHVNTPLLARTVAMVNELKPDLIAITGDIITSTARRLGDLIEPLSELRARVGVFASLGNHDVWNAAKPVVAALHNHGVKVLQNAGFGLTQGRETLWIAGIDSVWAGHPDPLKALRGSPAGAPCVMLGHEPDYADTLASLSPADVLQLAGHTHGGQVCLPGGIPIHLPKYGVKYAKGHFEIGNVQLYVNRGIGTITTKARFACPPEITEMTLSAAENG
jgi:predicted MPP superfamily phosphohydrolase